MSNQSNDLPLNCKFILYGDQQIPIDELLGSVTTYNNVEGSEKAKNMQIRTSARVFKKMKLDSTPSQTTSSPIIEKKEMIKEEIKPEGKKPLRLWEQEDKNLFFEALNEYGKDFEAIHAYITNKLKKKGAPESQFKTREQIRHLYYRTWHKISKYLIFSEEVKKVAQELYGLINYGELRKKLLFVSEKSCLKLNELIYRGFIAIRIRGKTIRIRTPMCRALRVLNQLDDGHNDLKLPLKINLELKPRDIDTWMTVQKLSQNPRVKTTVPLQRRVSALLLFLNEKWKSYETFQYESALKQSELVNDGQIDDFKPLLNLLRLSPPPNCNLDVPNLNVTEYLTSQNVCLNSYEERFGIETRGEELWLTSLSNSTKAHFKKNHTKRYRNESNSSEKLSPTCSINVKSENETTTDIQLQQQEQFQQDDQKIVSEVIDEAVNTILSLQNEEIVAEMCNVKEVKVEKVDETVNVNDLDEKKKDIEVLELKKGWTIANCGTLCVGDLYLMYGSDSKLTLEYSWDRNESKSETNLNEIEINHEIHGEINCENNHNNVSHILKRLLSMAKLHYRKNRVQCPCGHVCGGNLAKNRNRNIAKVITGREKFYNNSDKLTSIDPALNNEPNLRKVSPAILFRRPSSPNDLLMAQLDSIQKLRPRYCNRKGRRPRTKPVVVERKLPILANRVENGRQIVQMNIISHENVSCTSSSSTTTTITTAVPRLIAPKTLVAPEENEMTSPDEVDISIQSSLIEAEQQQTEVIQAATSSYNLISISPSADGQQNEQIVSSVNVTDNAITPSRVGSPSDISNLLQMALASNNSKVNIEVGGEEPTSFVGLLPSTASSGTSPSSPSRVLKENEDQWLNSEVADFSLSSFLGHLESPIKTAAQSTVSCTSEDSRLCLTQAVCKKVQSLLTESSLDYTAKFADLAAKVTDIQK